MPGERCGGYFGTTRLLYSTHPLIEVRLTRRKIPRAKGISEAFSFQITKPAPNEQGELPLIAENH